MAREDQSGKMLILAIDTSQKDGTVCLARGNASAFEILGTSAVDGGMFSAQLVPVVAALLARSEVKKEELQGIAAAVGPGSFTGLRIGLAGVKGLAEVLKLPIAAVSTLEAVAAQAGDAADVVAVLDAGRKEFYVGEYSKGKMRKESLLSRDQLSDLAAKAESVISLDSAVAEIAGKRFTRVDYSGAEMIARLGVRKLAAGDSISPDELDANYVRRDETLFAPKK